MFDFQKLDVYQKSKGICLEISALIRNSHFDRVTTDQIRRASLSIMLNIAEGSSRFSKKDRKHFLVISRGSVFECVAILEYLKESNDIDCETFKVLTKRFDEISRMLYGLIRKLEE